MNAPRERGIKSKNENLATFSLSAPLKSPAEIVIPLLETPGKSAKTWNKPIRREFLPLRFSLPELNLVRNKIPVVNKNAVPKNKNEENVVSIKFLKKYPKSAAGIVATIRYFQSFNESFLNVNRKEISFLVKIKTAISEAKWSAVKKNKFGSEIKLEKSARWPEDETGKNSVAAWTIARNISVNI